MNEASWTPNPVTERELAQVQRSGRLRRWLGWTLTLSALGLCPLSCLMGGVVRSMAPFAEIVLTIFVLSAGGLGFAYLQRNARDRSLRMARDARLAADYGDGAGWIVTLHVYQGAALTGIDRGLVWFEDDRLYFTGERTSFGLAVNQLRGKVRSDGWVSSLTSNLNLTLDARSEAGSVCVGLDVHESDHGRLTHRSVNSLAEAIRGWQSARGKSETGQIPPLALGPEAPTAVVLFRRAAAITGFWTLSALGLIALGLAQGWLLVFPLAIVGATLLIPWGDVWTPRRHWRAWHDRRRLEARG